MPPKKGKNGRNSTTGSKRGVSFEKFFTSVYGARWPTLRKSMTASTPKKVVLWNRFCQLPFEKAMANMKRVDDKSLLQVFCAESDELLNSPQPQLHQIIDDFNVRAHHLIDYTSALIVEQLEVTAFNKVLDMCAGSGENTITIAQSLSVDGVLIANETKSDRYVRLQRHIREYVPPNFVPVTITRRDAQTWYSPSTYHRVLVDVPCTCEGRIMQQHKRQWGTIPMSPQLWSEEKSRAMSTTQRTLLLRGIEACLPGGRIVYSTRSISPVENDDVVEFVLRRKRGTVEVQKITMTVGEATNYGWMVLPDTTGGIGPMYCCVMQKVSDTRVESEEEEDEEESDSNSDNNTDEERN
ncbi:SAM-dependent methyltransferase RsmB/NOP2-type [Trypanosoma melophagium]|uniref:SAM-dependent methyltransferase RsmB/NOP2-type n=1 Tax=Trypanosoma melophagium TaxID=715481 RepID=UPI00351A8017|nr:SAM-dependent methyltransferase RsmB/NOP2-type [Trypanosoma melophagium]